MATMKKWVTTLPPPPPPLPPPVPDSSSKPRISSRDSLSTVEEERMENAKPKETLEEEKTFYDHLENYRRFPPPPPSDSQADYALSSPSVLSAPSEYSYEDLYSEVGMFNGPVTDLDEDSDPDEIKIYNPATKAVTIKRRPRVSASGKVNVNINVNLAHLEEDIQRMIDEMANLEADYSDRSSSSKPDSGIEGSIHDGLHESAQNHRAALPPPASYGAKNRRLYWTGNSKWSIQRSRGDRDVRNVTCLVNENFDESRVFKASANGVPLGMAAAGQPQRPGDWRSGGLGPPKQAMEWRSRGLGSLKRAPHWHLPATAAPVHEKERLCSNVISLMVAMLLVSVAYFSVANGQTTLRPGLELGMISLMTEKASALVCVLFIPTIISRWPGRKWGAALGALLAGAWPAVQLLPPDHPELFGLSAVAAALQGLASALLWGSALPLACEVGEPRGAAATTLLLGALLGAWQLGQLGAGVLTTAVMVGNGTWLPAEGAGPRVLERCAPLPPADAAALLEQLHPVWLPLLAAPIVAALFVAVAVRAPARAECTLDAGGPGGAHGLLHPLRHLGGCRQLLLVPSAALSGMVDVFFTADYTKEASSTAWGGARAGAGPAAAGLAHASALLLLAPLAAHARARAPLAALCALLLAAGGAALLCPWPADASLAARLLVPAALAGAGASLDLAAAAAAALAFPERRGMAFSFLLAARAGGSLLLLALTHVACMDAKLLVMAGTLLAAAACTAALERLWGAGAPPPAPRFPPDDDPHLADDDGMVEVSLERPRHW